jgi:hypothetical protein
LNGIRAVCEATGATVGQVHLAAMAAAWRVWKPPAQAQGKRGAQSRERATCLIPVDTRSVSPETGESTYANRIGLLSGRLPCHQADPLRQLATVMSDFPRGFLGRQRVVLRALTEEVPERVAGWALRRLTDPARVAVTISHVPVDAPLSVMGQPVEEVGAVPWLPPGGRCFTLAVTYGGQFRLSVLTPGRPPDPADLVSLWASAIADLRRLTA